MIQGKIGEYIDWDFLTTYELDYQWTFLGDISHLKKLVNQKNFFTEVALRVENQTRFVKDKLNSLIPTEFKDLAERTRVNLLNQFVSIVLIKDKGRQSLNFMRLHMLESLKRGCADPALQNFLDLYSFLYERPRIIVKKDGLLNTKQIKTVLISFKKNLGIKKQDSTPTSGYLTNSVIKRIISDELQKTKAFYTAPRLDLVKKDLKSKWVGPRLWQFINSFDLPEHVKSTLMTNIISRCEQHSSPDAHFLDTLNKLK